MYAKFVVKRKMNHYYGPSIGGYKMVLISKYDDDDVVEFIKTTQLKQQQHIREELEKFGVSNVPEKKENQENEEKEDDQDSERMDNEKIQRALMELCGDEWKAYFGNFQKHEVFDDDLETLTQSDLQVLIPRIGPRVRVQKWIEALKANKE